MASGTPVAIPSPMAANPAMPSHGVRAATIATAPSTASTPPICTVRTGPSRRTIASPVSLPMAMVTANPVTQYAPTAAEACVTVMR